MIKFLIFKGNTLEIISKKLKIKIAFVIAFVNEVINKSKLINTELKFDYYDIGNISFKIGISIKKAKEIFAELLLLDFVKNEGENLFSIQISEDLVANLEIDKSEKRKIQLRNAQAKFRAKKNNHEVIEDNQNFDESSNQKIINGNQKISSLSAPLSSSLSPRTPISPSISSPLSSLPPIMSPKCGTDFSEEILEKRFEREPKYSEEFEDLWLNASENLYKKLNRDIGSKKKAFRKWKKTTKIYQNKNIVDAIFTCTTAIKLLQKGECVWFSIKEFDGFLDSRDKSDKKKWLYWFEKFKEIQEVKNQLDKKTENSTSNLKNIEISTECQTKA